MLYLSHLPLILAAQPGCLKGAGKKSRIEGLLHVYDVHKDRLTSSGRRMELLSQALDLLLESTNEAEPLFFKVEGYVNDLYATYQVRA